MRSTLTNAVRSRRAALLVFAAAVVLSAWRFYRVRNYFDFCDEAAETTTAWLVSNGETLYGSVFSHHMPLAVIASHLVASVSPTDHPAHFRATPWAAYVLLALTITFGPCGRRRPVAGAIAGAAFLVVASLLAPLLWAHLVLNEVFWGAAFAMFLALLPLPLLLGEEPRPVDAFVAGAAASLSLAGSPMAAFPLALGFAISVLLTSRELLLSRAGAFFAGGGAAAAFVVAWLLRFGDLGGFREECFRFNQLVYARFLGNANTPAGMVRVSAVEWVAYVSHAIRDAAAGNIQALLLPPILVVIALLVFVSFLRRGFARGPWQALALASLASLMVVSLRLVRGGEFRAIPLHIATFALAAVLPWAGSFRRPRLVATIVALTFIPALLAAARHESFRFHEDSRLVADGAWLHVARYVEAHTKPDERIASFPVMPSVYLEARRRPATDSVYYLPWQAVWEKENPSRTSTCAQLRAHAPRYVALQASTIWGYFPWDDYAACIDRFLKDEYETVDLPELGGLLLRRKEAR